jgi:hypothetical protein
MLLTGIYKPYGLNFETKGLEEWACKADNYTSTDAPTIANPIVGQTEDRKMTVWFFIPTIPTNQPTIHACM